MNSSIRRHSVLLATLLLLAIPAFAQCTLEAVDILSPRNLTTIVVGQGADDIPFIPIALPDCESDTSRVSFDLDGDALGYVTEAPYALTTSPFADWPFGQHSLVATADNISTVGLFYQSTHTFTTVQAGVDVDVDLNGYPDNPFATLAGNGYQWVSQTAVADADGLRRVGILRWAGSGGTANPLPLVVPLADSLNPSRCVLVYMPPNLLVPGEVGMLMVTAADDLDTLIGPAEAALLDFAPDGMPAAGQFVNIAIIISTDGGLTLEQIAPSRLAAHPLTITMQGFGPFPPQGLTYYSHPTSVALTANGIDVIAETGFWDPGFANDVEATPRGISATLTGLGIFALFPEEAAEGEGEGEEGEGEGEEGEGEGEGEVAEDFWPWVVGIAAAIVAALAIGQGGGGGGGGGGCFIATAAYGTPMAGSIDVLRDFRDVYLLENPVGTAFVDMYYHVSPPLADFIAVHPALAAVVRVALWPVIVMAKAALTMPPATAGLLALMAAVWIARASKRVKREGTK